MTLVVTPKGNIDRFLDQLFEVTTLRSSGMSNGSIMYSVTESNFGKVKKQLESSIAQTSNYYNKQDVFKLLGNYHKEIHEVFVWEKSNPLPASGLSVTNAYEFIICFGSSLKSNKTYTKNHLTTSVAKMYKEHKAVMNDKVASFFIENFTKENDIIYDPFMGCGTTGVICKINNRSYIGSEISKEYCDISNQRINSTLF